MFDSQEDPEINTLKSFGKSSLGMIARTVGKIGSFVYRAVTSKFSSNQKKGEVKDNKKATKQMLKQKDLSAKISQDINKDVPNKNNGLGQQIKTNSKEKAKISELKQKPSFKEKQQGAIIQANKQNSELGKQLGDRIRQIKVKTPGITK